MKFWLNHLFAFSQLGKRQTLSLGRDRGFLGGLYFSPLEGGPRIRFTLGQGGIQFFMSGQGGGGYIFPNTIFEKVPRITFFCTNLREFEAFYFSSLKFLKGRCEKEFAFDRGGIENFTPQTVLYAKYSAKYSRV